MPRLRGFGRWSFWICLVLAVATIAATPLLVRSSTAFSTAGLKTLAGLFGTLALLALVCWLVGAVASRRHPDVSAE